MFSTLKNIFIRTGNVGDFEKGFWELQDRTSVGPSMGLGSGPAGRGKTETSKKMAVKSSAIYLPPWNQRSPLMLLRELCFELAKETPGRIDSCLNVISREMTRERRLIIIDEADLLPYSILEMLRNLNERYSCPIILIGEAGLEGKLGARRRLSSRIRWKMEFKPVTQADISLYFRKALDLEISASDTALVQRHCKGDWRPVLTLAVSIHRAMRASGLNELPKGLVRQVIDERGE